MLFSQSWLAPFFSGDKPKNTTTEDTPLLMNLENKLQNYLSASFLAIKKRIPQRLQDYAVNKIDQASNYLLQNMPQSFYANNLQAAVYDKAYYEGDFISQVDDLIENRHTHSVESFKQRLTDLQSFIGKLTLSPYIYNAYLQQINHKVEDKYQDVIKNILEEFAAELRAQPQLVQECFVYDMNKFVNELSNRSLDLNYYKQLIEFYRSVSAELDFFNIISCVFSILEDNAENLKKIFSEQDVRSFLKSLQSDLDGIDRNILVQQSTIVNNFKALPFFELNDQRLEDYLAENYDEPEFVSSSTLLQNALSLTKKVMHYSANHKMETLITCLNAQLVAVAAFQNVYQPVRQVEAVKEVLHQKRITTNNILPDFQVNTNTGVHANPSVLTNNNKFNILFDAPDGSGSGICVREYNQYAQPVAPQFRVNSNTANDQSNGVGVVQNNEYRLAWQTYDTDGTGTNIVGARFRTSDWSVLESDSGINTNRNGNQTVPALDTSPNTTFYTWTSDASDGSFTGVVGRCRNSLGNFLGPDFNVNTYTNSYQQFSNVIYNPFSNEFLVVYESALQDGSGYGIFARRYTETCTPIGSEFQINTSTSGNQRFPSGATNGTNYAIGWEYNTDVFAKRLSSGGTTQGSEFRVNINTGGNQSGIKVSLNTNGNYLFQYPCNSLDGDGGICGQEVSSNGIFVDGEVLINSYTNGLQTNPNAKGFPNGDPKNFVSTWQGTFSSGNDQIVARVFNTSSLEPPNNGTSTTSSLPSSTTQNPTTATTAITSAAITTAAITTAAASTLSQSTTAELTTGPIPSTSSSSTTDNPSTSNTITTANNIATSTTNSFATTNNPSSTTYQTITTSLLSTNQLSSSGTTGLQQATTQNVATTDKLTTSETTQVAQSSSEESSNVPAIIGAAAAALGVCAIGTTLALIAKRKCGQKTEKKRLEQLTKMVFEKLEIDEEEKTPEFEVKLNYLLIKVADYHLDRFQLNLETPDTYLLKEYSGIINKALETYVFKERSKLHFDWMGANTDHGVKAISKKIDASYKEVSEFTVKRLEQLTQEVLKLLNIDEQKKTPEFQERLNNLLTKVADAHFKEFQTNLETLDKYALEEYARHINNALKKYVHSESNESRFDWNGAKQGVNEISKEINVNHQQNSQISV